MFFHMLLEFEKISDSPVLLPCRMPSLACAHVMFRERAQAVFRPMSCVRFLFFLSSTFPLFIFFVIAMDALALARPPVPHTCSTVCVLLDLAICVATYIRHAGARP